MALRLHELGPRLSLNLVKIEEGVCRGNVVHHAHIQRSPAEIKKQLDGLKNKRDLKEKRKQLQEANVKRKAVARGELPDDEEADKKKDGNEAGQDVRDEGDDKRAQLGKRLNNQRDSKPSKSASKNAPQAKKPTLNPGKRTRSSEPEQKKRSRPVDKESRLRRLGKWKDTGKKDGGKKDDRSKSARKSTPTFKKQKR